MAYPNPLVALALIFISGIILVILSHRGKRNLKFYVVRDPTKPGRPKYAGHGKKLNLYDRDDVNILKKFKIKGADRLKAIAETFHCYEIKMSDTGRPVLILSTGQLVEGKPWVDDEEAEQTGTINVDALTRSKQIPLGNQLLEVVTAQPVDWTKLEFFGAEKLDHLLKEKDVLGDISSLVVQVRAAADQYRFVAADREKMQGMERTQDIALSELSRKNTEAQVNKFLASITGLLDRESRGVTVEAAQPDNTPYYFIGIIVGAWFGQNSLLVNYGGWPTGLALGFGLVWLWKGVKFFDRFM